MARATYVIRNGELVEKHLASPLHPTRDAPNIRPDGMDAIRSQADGRMYDSKSGYYQSVRAAGCEIVGDDRKSFDRKPEFQPTISGPDIKQAIEQLRNR